MCQIDVLYGKSLIIDFLDDFLKKRTAIMYICCDVVAPLPPSWYYVIAIIYTEGPR